MPVLVFLYALSAQLEQIAVVAPAAVFGVHTHPAAVGHTKTQKKESGN